MTPSSLSTSPSTPPNRPPHRIHRKPFAFTLDTFAFPPLSPSALHLPHHLNPGAESPRLLSSPEPQSSPCTSDFDDDDDEYDSENESEIGEEEDRYRRGQLSMPRLQASLNLRTFGAEEGGSRRINFARPLGSQGTINLQQQEQVELDSEEEEDVCRRIVDKEVVQHLFGRSIQRTRRLNSITNTISTRDLSTLGLDSSPSIPLALPPLPVTLSNPAHNRITPTPSIRSELSSASHASSLAARRLASTKAAYKDEFAEMAAKDEAEATTKRLAGKEMMVLEGLAGLGLFEDQGEEEHEERRRGIDFGGVSELGVLDPREERKEVLSPIVVFDDDEEAPVVERGRKAFSRGRSRPNSPFASSSRPSTPIAISAPQPLLSTPTSTTKSTRPTSLGTPYDFALIAHTPASALALFASIPTSERVALPLPLPSPSASLQPSPSLSSSLRSVSSSNTTSTSLPEAPPRTIIAGAYTTRQNRRTVNPAPPIGLRELRELRTAALVLEMDAKRHVKVPGSLVSHPREMEKKLKRKPVPVGVDGEDTVVIKVPGGSESSGSGSGSPSEVVDKDGKEIFLSFPEVIAPLPRSSVRPPRSSARPLSIAIMPSSPPLLRQTLSSSDAIPLLVVPTTTQPSSLLLQRATPAPAFVLAPPTLVRRSTTSNHAHANSSASSLPLPTRRAPLPPTQRSTLPATSTPGSTNFKITLPHLTSSSSLHYSTHSRSVSRSQRRRSSRASSTSSFESCPIPPTPLEASFFPSCPTPSPDELPRTNSLLFDLLRAEEETQSVTGVSVEGWSAGVEELRDDAVEERRRSRRNASPTSTSSSFSSSQPTPNTGAGVGLGLGLGMKGGLGGLKGLKWGANLKQSGVKMQASLGGKRVWSGTKALNATTTSA